MNNNYNYNVFAIYFNFRNKDTLYLQGGTKWLVPKCPLLKGSTVLDY